MPGIPLRRALRGLLVLASLAWVPWATALLIDLDGVTWLVPSAIAFLPYLGAFTVATLIVAAATRHRLAITLAMVGVLVIVAPRIGRFAATDQPAARGPQITVATSNVYAGKADLDRFLRVLRAQRVDILAMQENTPDWDARLRAAGLDQQFPYWTSVPDPTGGASGLAVLSRWPITTVPPARGDTRSHGGTITVPGTSATTSLHVRSVHPYPPVNRRNLACWRTCTPKLAHTRSAGESILAGDYNATLDHHPMRDLLTTGYRDAADETGDTWRPTWSGKRILHLTIDHILISDGIAAQRLSVHDLPGSDHDIVVTRLRLPR